MEHWPSHFSTDIWKTYDSLNLGAVIAIVNLYPIPRRVKYVFLTEVLAAKRLKNLYAGAYMCAVYACSGFVQDSPEASFMFIIIGHILADLDAK